MPEELKTGSEMPVIITPTAEVSSAPQAAKAAESDFPFAVSVSDVYEGPLDLLLDLIRKQDIDIYDIPVAKITAQYLAYVSKLRELDVNVADVIDLVKTFQKVLDRARTRPIIQVDEEAVTVGQMIDYLRRRLALEERPVRLMQLLRHVNSRNALVCMFLALLELVRLQAIQVRQDRLFGEIVVRKHTHFDEVMNQQAAVRDDWR